MRYHQLMNSFLASMSERMGAQTRAYPQFEFTDGRRAVSSAIIETHEYDR
jgi:hypothetical protein